MSEYSDDKPRIAGCSFSVHPMSDNFADIITSALDEIDTSKVWMQTDKVSTIVRGRIAHIFDVTRAVLVKTAQTGEHVAFHATYSVGCPGDTSGHSYMAEDEVPLNVGEAEENSQPIAAKFALYPMSGGDYMDVIYEQIEEMKKEDIEVNLTHYETRLDGDAYDIFSGLETVFKATEEAGSNHTVMTLSVSANSPTS